MSAFRLDVTYQGYPVKTCAYRRSDGLTPEPGYVDISIEALKKISIEPRQVPWRAVNGFEFDGGMSIAAFAKLSTTVTQPPALPAPSGGGLNLFGDLVFRTYKSAVGGVEELAHETTYRDIFVDFAGLEEITEDLADIEPHDKGTIRVPLTDIRRFYENYGPFAQSINAKLKSGGFDPLTVKPDGETWSAETTVKFLFSQLPGSPLVVRMDMKGVETPSDITGTGDPVLQVLTKVLDQMGLVPKMQPDGNYVVRKKMRSVAQGTIFDGPDSSRARDPEDHLSYETKTQWMAERPPAVQVFGKRRVRRITTPYIPAVRDEHGNLAKLFDYIDEIGYSRGQLNAQVLAGEKNFEDVPGSGKLHATQREILRTHAYKTYAPAFLFAAKEAEQSAKEKQNAELSALLGISISTPSIRLTDEDFEKAQFLPIVDVPFYVDELEAIDVKIPGDTQDGDRGKFVVVPPVVRGRRVGQGLCTNFADVTRRFGELEAGDGLAINNLLSQLKAKISQRDTVGKSLARSQEVLQEIANVGGNPNLVTRLEGDLSMIPQDVHKHAEIARIVQEDLEAQQRKAAQIDLDVADIKAKINEARQTAIRHRDEFQAFSNAYREILGSVGVQAIINLPYGVVEGRYTLTRETGVIEFAEPMCHMAQPVLLAGETGAVVNDGAISITYGYEERINSIEDWTSVIFTTEIAEETSPANEELAGFLEKKSTQVWVVGVSRSTPIKCKVERAPTMRLYESDEGTPFNLGAVVKEAGGKAFGQLVNDITQIGYASRYGVFFRAALEAGIQSVQYAFDGSSGSLFIHANSPNSRISVDVPGLGPAVLARQSKSLEVVLREAWSIQ